MSRLHDVLVRPVVTEKAHTLDKQNKIIFEVRQDATKHQIRAAVEQLLGVEVAGINTLHMPFKPKRYGRHSVRRSGFKKAIITLKEGQVLDLFALEQAEAAGEDEQQGTQD